MRLITVFSFMDMRCANKGNSYLEGHFGAIFVGLRVWLLGYQHVHRTSAVDTIALIDLWACKEQWNQNAY